MSGSNQSGARSFRVQPGVKLRIQACNRGGLFQKSGCTGWYSIGIYGSSRTSRGRHPGVCHSSIPNSQNPLATSETERKSA